MAFRFRMSIFTMKSTVLIFKLFFILSAFNANAELDNRPVLKGVMAKNWPFLGVENGTFKGFLVDLMDKIANQVGIRFEIRLTDDSAYNTIDHNYKLFKIVSDVFKNRADFALADLTITDARKRYVDFTEPFMEYQMAALVRKDHATRMTTLSDLVDHNLEIEKSSDINRKREKINYCTIHSRATIYNLTASRNPTALYLYNWLEEHPEEYMESRKIGIEKVQQGRYAFLVESSYAEYVAGGKCNLAVLHDNESMYRRHFAIALPKRSQYLSQFSNAIRELTATGQIQQIRQRYWKSKCN